MTITLVLAWTVAVSTSESLALVTASVAAVAAALSSGIAAWQGVLMKKSERNRTQPIVVVYEQEPPKFDNGTLLFAVSLANEGAGPAVNIRFGVSIDEAVASYTARPAGPGGAGDVPRVLGAGRTLPEGDRLYPLAFPLSSPNLQEALERRVY